MVLPLFAQPASWGALRDFLGAISVWTVIDILLVAFLIYQVLLLVRGTRASAMLLGIGLIVFLYYASRWWKLDTVHWLLTTLLPYFVFALIVLFQQEIRRALMRVGRYPLAPWLSQLGRQTNYDDILLAANLFSSQKTGALMVLERDVGLRTFIESGIKLDATLSYDLLATIFRPGATLHDGAVIIQKDRIAAAACFLPLSASPILGTQMGTRHRAALGITEEADAVAVVISEETGQISLAVGGAVEQNISLERLRTRLTELLGVPISPAVLPISTLTAEPEVTPMAPQDTMETAEQTSRTSGQAARP
jgi:diadenylate cyclase